MRAYTLIGLGLIVGIALAGVGDETVTVSVAEAADTVAVSPAAGWTIAENNAIVQIYAGKTTPAGTELVFELKTMHFYSNQHLYGCIFVVGRIVMIKEYNVEDSYVRGVVALPGDGEIVAYAGVVKARERIDPHNHAGLWNAFVNSQHKPFKAKLRNLPKWYVTNPIKVKKAAAIRSAPKPSVQDQSHPYLKPEQRPAKAREALAAATGDRDRYCAVWGLAISGYCPQSAEALVTIAVDRHRDKALRECAAMGLINFRHSMPVDVRRAIQDKLYGALAAEKENLQGGVVQTLVAWGDADRVRKVFGDKLRDHPLEVIVLKKISCRETAVARLWEIYQATPMVKSGSITLGRRWHAGEALIHWKDKRGIDILLECLTADRGEHANSASLRRSLYNTFGVISSATGKHFGYSISGNWRPELGEATAKMVKWWQAHRKTWCFAGE